MPRYADLDNLITDYIPEATSDEEIASIGRILDSVSAFVDSYCRRQSGYFAPSPDTPSMKRVRSEGGRFLRLPVHVFGSVVVDAADASLYYESDVNGWLYREGGLSADCVVNSSFALEAGYSQWTPEGVYRVTARWGYAATPLPVAEAVRLITARIWQTQRGTIGQTTSEGFIQEKLIPQAARDFLQQFIRRQFEV